MFSGLRQDITYALRSFRQNPGFTAAVAVSIALGIAANTTVFTIVDSMLLGELGVREPGRLMNFSHGNSFSWPDYVDLREQTKAVFTDITARFILVPASVGGRGEPERVWGQLVTGNFFNTVGVPMATGRGIGPHEDQVPGRDAVVVLSYGLWQRRFGGDPALIGRDVLLNGNRYTVLGVTAKGFHGVDRALIADFWVPMAMAEQIMPALSVAKNKEQRTAHWIMLMGRLRPGVSRQQAVTAVNVVAKRLHDSYYKSEQLRPVTLEEAGGLPGPVDTGATALLAVLMIVVGMLLMIACVNVAGLLLSRATARQREIGVRLSIGATRGRLVRQLLTESILLSCFGAIPGFLLAWGATRAIAGFQMPLPVPVGLEFRPDLRVLLFTAALAVLTGLVFGLVPALRATRPDLVSWLKSENRGFGHMRQFGIRNALVLVQVALSLVLLIGAGLFLRSLQNASSIDLGFRANGVVSMAFHPSLHHYTPERTQTFMRQLQERVAALPGVQSVAFTDVLPLSLGGTSMDFSRPGAPPSSQFEADMYEVGGNYLATTGISLLRGRWFRPEGNNTSTVVIDEAMARRLYGTQDPIGQMLRYTGSQTKDIQVIGVVSNSKSRTLGEQTAMVAYFPMDAPGDATLSSFFGTTVLARSTVPAAALERAIKEQIRALDPLMPVSNVETLQEHVNKSLLLPRLCALLLGVFGVTGVVLASVGLFGVMSYAARARTKEIGIRMALGARPRGVLGLVARQGLVVTGVGLVVGLLMAFALTRFTASFLYGVSATDAVTFVAVPVLLLAIALVAVLGPAHKASRVDPLRALRYE